MRTIFLFDIDGTLLCKAGPAHRQSLELAARQIAGQCLTTDSIDTGGMLDRDIIRLMMSQAGIAEKRIQRMMPQVVAQAQRIYPTLCPDLRPKIAPGARALLYGLKRAGVPCGLVTGNLSRIGWHKMTKAGLRGHFSFGAFAEMGRSRAELVAKARRMAPPHEQAILIGDHLNDIRAARENGIRIVSVATGPMSKAQLEPFQPDHLLDSLEQLNWREAAGY